MLSIKYPYNGQCWIVDQEDKHIATMCNDPLRDGYTQNIVNGMRKIYKLALNHKKSKNESDETLISRIARIFDID